ncbi:hypothetical protein, partial [Aureimonas endophytica]|uniref:hypothetical protein n=1 Tax=Aureimonas endophytica TaxID=2027858 RepID=UPI00166952B4
MPDSLLASSIPLTVGLDVLEASAGQPLLVRGTSSTLNVEDRLTGGSEHDVLSLTGSGSFDLSKL